MSATAKFKYIASGNVQKDGEVHLEDYRVAQDSGMTLTQYVNAKYSDADPAYGDAFDVVQSLFNSPVRFS